ncbi:MAG: 16S rRNA (uracil(1498)-N(3))-methyltransferase [Desulfovibrio sp.]|nr:16S rRNA (uracil(1498)-N(3))-methyltransferase [Desulfovibrio sp.]
MSRPCVYLPPDQWGDTVRLEGAEANHLTRVLRIAEGEEVSLLNGEGRTGLFLISERHKHYCVLKLIKESQAPRPLSRPIIALALSKAVRRGFFMEKAVELGAHEIWLWQGDHSQGHLSPEMAQSLKRQMIAGAKQCRNPWLPTIRLFPKGLEELLPSCQTVDYKILPWELEKNSSLLSLNQIGLKGTSLYCIGPEGGFSDRELSLLATADFSRVSLGQRILRCETAALLCLGLHFWASHQAREGDA